MSQNSQDSVALLSWGGQPDRVIQDVEWVLDDREDSTNQLRATTTLAEGDGIEDEQELIFQNRRFIVSGVERDRDADRATIVADEAQVELAGHVLTDFEFNSWTAQRALEHALKDTRWTPGEVANVRFGRAQFEDLTVLEACHFLANHQDAHVTFDSLRRRVNIVVQRGTKHERVFTYGRELENIEKESRQPETTVIYPTGADDLTIEHVNNGRDFVEDYGYYTSRGVSLADARKWYRKEDHWSDSRYEYASNMKRDAEKRLADEAYPAITYTLTAGVTTATDGTDDDLDLTGIGLGDTVYVWDDEIDAKLSAEVSAVTTSSDQSRNELVLSTLPESFGGTTRRGSGRYFGDSGSTAGDHPLFPRSGFQPRPSMPILANITDVGVGTVRWNGQDHDGNYTTIPVRFGSVVPVVAKVAEDGSIPSPDSDGAYEGGPIHSRGGGLSTVAFGAPGEFAVWFYMLGQDGRTRSEYSEPLMVTVDALVNVDDIDAELQESRQRIQDAADEAEQRFQDYDQRQDQFAASIGNATDRLSEAETRLNATETTVSEARDFASNAQTAAEHAEARAVEAMANVQTVLPNGGFEAGLTNWVSEGANLGSTTVHSGDQSVWLQDGGWIRPDDPITARDGQVWDLGFYYYFSASGREAQVMVESVDDQDGRVELDQWTLTSPTGGQWHHTGPLRFEVPAGVSRVSFTISYVDHIVFVDNVSLRDVTDVVRLERAAQQARDHADQALDRVGDMEFAMNGVEQKLADAQAELQQKVDASRLHELDSKLAQLGLNVSKIWRQDDPPPAGTTYEWTDGAHMSPSEKREDGVIVGQNLSFNPSFETGNHYVNTGSATSVSRTTFANAVLTGDYGLTVTLSGASTASGYVQQQVDLSGMRGQYVAVGTSARKSGSGGPNYARLYASWPGSSGSAEYMSDGYELPQVPMKEAPRMAGVVRIPDDAQTANLWLRFFDRPDGGSPADGIVHTDGWLIVTGATRQGALDRLQGFFDGDTPDDRQNDLWYDADGVPHFWLKGWGWAVLDDDRIEQLRDQMETLGDRLGEAEELLDQKADTSALSDLSGNVTKNAEALSAAQQALDDAQSTLEGLPEEVSAAVNDAADAQATAAQAVREALSAANIANGKGEIIPQVSAPSGSRARAENLWVRLPDYKVHVYDVAQSDWFAVTDPDLIVAAQTATDALNAAENARSRAAALELAVDGEGGLSDRLTTAETTLAEKADTSALSQLDQKLDTSVSGLSDRLGTAEDTLGRKADSSALNALDEKLSGDVSTLDDRLGTAETTLGQKADTSTLNQLDDKLSGDVSGLDDRLGTAEESINSKADSSRVEEVEGQVDTALTGPVTHDRLRAGSGAFDSAFVDELWAKNIRALSAELARAVIAAQNLYPDPGFQDVDRYSPWSVVNGGLEKNGTNSTDGVNYWVERIPAAPGDQFRLRATITWLVGSTGRVAVYCAAFDETGSYISGTNVPALQVDADGQGTVESEYTAPEGTASIRIGFFTESDMRTGSRVRIEGFNLSHMVDGSLVVENTIDARHLNVTGEMAAAIIEADTARVAELLADEIWAELGVFQRLDAREAYIGGTHLKNGAVTADKMTITGDLAAAIISADKARIAELISDEIWAELGVFQRLDAREAYIGGTHLADGAVTAEKMTITGDLAAAIVSADEARISEILADTMWAELGVFDRLEAREGWIGGVNLADGVVTAEKIEASREMITRIMGAEWAYIAEQLIVDGKILTRDLEALSAAIQNLDVTEQANIAELFAQEIWSALGVFDRLDAREAYVGGAHLKDGAVTAEKITITGDLAAAIVEADTARIVEIISHEVWARVVRAGLLEADEALIGEVLIKNNAVTLDKLRVTGDMAAALVEADKARFINLFANELIANNADLITASIKDLSVTNYADFVDAFAELFRADEFVARVATLGRAIIAAPNLIPHWAQINEQVPDGFEEFSHNPNDPSIYVSNSNTVNQSTRMHLVAGEPYVFSVDARSTFSYNTYTIALYSDELGFVGFFASFEVPGTSFSTLEHDFTVEETRDDYYLQFRPMQEIESGFQWFRNLNIQHALDGRLIVPDTIETRHLRVTEDMTAALLRAKKVEAGDIDANAINGMTIEGGIVKGGRVEGAALIGGRVDVGPRYTTTNGNRGISLSENGVFRMYDSLGELSTIIDGVNNRFTGRVSTARPGSPGMIFEPASSNANRPGIYMSPDGQASGNHGGVYTDNLWRLVLRGRRTSSGATRNRILVEGGFYITEGRFTSDVSATFTNGVNISGPESAVNDIYNRSRFHYTLHYPGAPNTTDPANVHIGGVTAHGQFFRRTSSIRDAKVNIESVPEEIAERLLDLDPRDWIDRTALAEALGDQDHLIHDNDEPGVGPTVNEEAAQDAATEMPRRVPGLVAEEVRDVGLDDYVTYHVNHETGEEELSSVAYDRLWTLLIPLVRKQRDQISEQQSRIDDLEARLARLEAKL